MENKIGPRIRIHITMDEVVTALFSGWGGGLDFLIFFFFNSTY